MRAVEANWYRNFLTNLGNTKSRYDKAITESTSGKRLNHLSDDPSDMSYVLSLRSQIGQVKQFDDNINSGKLWLSSGESSLNQVQNLLSSAITMASQGSSESGDAQSRLILADRLDDLRDELLNYSNTEVMGRYIFAGSNTDTAPFVKAADTVLPSGVVVPGVVTYTGNSDTVSIQADFTVTVGTNVPGDEVFTGPVDIFDRLSQLIQGLRENNTTAISTQTGQLKESVDQISDAIGLMGERNAHLTQIQGLLKNFKTTLTSKMSSLEDANMAEAISNLAKEEVGLQATLQAGSRINRISLMNFLS